MNVKKNILRYSDDTHWVVHEALGALTLNPVNEILCLLSAWILKHLYKELLLVYYNMHWNPFILFPPLFNLSMSIRVFYVDWYLRSVLNLNFANTTQLKQSNPCLRDVKTFLHRFKTNWNSYTNSLLRCCWYFKVFQRPLDSHECRGQL